MDESLQTKVPFLYLRAEMGQWVYFLLGSNQGDREGFLREALAALKDAVAVGATRASAVYETAAWGLEDQPAFLNMAVGMETELSPVEVLGVIRNVEARLGRQREVVWGQRTLDIDILLFGDMVVATPELSIPHPRLQDRRFALVPLAEIAGEVIHPTVGVTINLLLRRCEDPLGVVMVGSDAGPV